MHVSLATVSAREKLKPRREPYWHKLDRGSMLGFRKMTATSAGTWIARFRNPETGERPKKALGDFSDLPPSERFGAAKRAADEWFSHLGKGGTSKAITVKTACAHYVQHVRENRGDGPADDIAARYRRWVNDSPIGGLELGKLTRAKVETWRKALAATPAQVNRDDRPEPVTRPRAASSLNRDMTALRAALNHAHDLGLVTSDMPWRVALRPIKNADGRRSLYLDRTQRRALIGAAPSDVAAFLRVLSAVPLRPGAVAALEARHFDKRLSTLIVGKDKNGADRRIQLPPLTAALFADLAKDKLPAAPLLSRADGAAWNKDSWYDPVKEAAAASGLPSSTTAYTLRHSVITDLVTGGLDLLTVAQLSGTSVAMIERHYGHLRNDHATAALAGLTF